MKTVYSAEVIAERISELGREIREKEGDEELTFLAILKGTTVFLADLIRAIPGEVNYEMINVVRSVADTQTSEALQINFITNFFLEGRKIFVLKDVVSTGVIESYLLTQLRQKIDGGLKLIALLDKPAMRTVPLEVDYSLFTVEDGVWIGYGLELDGKHGNLPDIRTL